MATLALLLHEPAARKVRDWWDLLEAQLGIRGVRKVPFPHVTLFGCEGIDHPSIQEVLDELCFRTPPLELRSIGLGLFARPMPVIYAPVIRNQALSELHQELWEAVGRLGGSRFRLYSPEQWIPHMTLAQFDLTRENQLEALRLLLEEDLELSFEVRNLTLFDWIGPKYEPRERYQLRG
jgi:2'-5' RNA ligase